MDHVSVWRWNAPIVATLIATLGMPVIADAQQYVRVSESTAGTAGDGQSTGSVLSANGQFVVFSSDATNLVSNDTNHSRDVFVRDLVAKTTTRVSVTSAGADAVGESGVFRFPAGGQARDTPGVSITPNGTLVAFESRAALVAADTNSCTVNNAAVNCSDIYVHEGSTGATELVSVATGGAIANGESSDPSVSADGRYVVFTSSATNLRSGDFNGLDDVFLRDRQTGTTTRLSSMAGGGDLNGASYGARISGDGQIVAFISEASEAMLDGSPDPMPCLITSGACARAYVLDRGTGKIVRVPIPATVGGGPTATGASAHMLAMTSDGRYIALALDTLFPDTYGPYPAATLVVYDRVTGHVEVDGGSLSPQATISDNGRYVALGGGLVRAFPFPPFRFDRQTNTQVFLAPLLQQLTTPGQFSPDGSFVVFDDTASYLPVPGYGSSPGDVYIFKHDADGDGMPDDWETQFGLNPNDPADASLDPDGDGRTNLQEYLAGTDPVGTFKRYFAEGAANSFFTTTFALLNPGDQPAKVLMEFLGSNGLFRSTFVLVPPHTRNTLVLNSVTTMQPDSDFSTVVESDQPVVVDRTMTWDASGYGSHSETAITAPGTTWFLAEGATHGAFDLFYLIENPGETDASVTINYLRPAPNAPVVKMYAVAAKSRRTIWVDQEGPELAETDVSAKIVSDQPILVERAMYYSTPSQAFAGGTDGAALPAPATRWFLAEGATGGFFDLYVLIANAESTDAQVSVTYLTPSGAPIVKAYTIAANSRRTISVQGEDPALFDTPVSTIVQSTNDVPVLVERAMWWPKGNWYEGHLTAGSTTTGTKWAIADGEVSPGDNGNETYILIANTSATAGTATVTLYFGSPAVAPPLAHTIDLPANSRVNVPVSSMFPETLGVDGQRFAFGAVVESNGTEIVVERATYGNANGVVWARGASALGTKLQ